MNIKEQTIIEGKKILDLIRNTVREIVPSAEILLYGSRARGNARQDSDWDVLVLLDVDTLSRKHREIDFILWEKGQAVGEEINTTVRTREQWMRNISLYKHNVIKDAIKL